MVFPYHLIMKTSRLILKLEQHLKTQSRERNPEESDVLMGHALIQLQKARELLQEVVYPSQFLPEGSFSRKEEARRKEFLA